MNSKQQILTKLKSAPGQGQKTLPEIVPDKIIYSHHVEDKQKMLQQFIERQKNLAGEVITCDSIEKMAAALAGILKEFGPSSAKHFKNELLDEILKINPVIKNYIDQETDLNISSPDFSKYSIGISGAEYLIARTGSIFLNSLTGGGRRLTVLPPVHIVLARQSQMVASPDNVLENISNTDNTWSYATFITGPSRTSDIEKKLVLGAHGPKRLVTLILKD